MNSDYAKLTTGKIMELISALSLDEKKELSQRVSESIALHVGITKVGLHSRVGMQLAMDKACEHVFGHKTMSKQILYKLSDRGAKEINTSLERTFGKSHENRVAMYELVFRTCLQFAERREIAFPAAIAKFITEWPTYFEQAYPGYLGAGMAPMLLDLSVNPPGQ